MSGDGMYGYHKFFYLYKDSQHFMKAYRLRAIHGDAPFKVYDAPVQNHFIYLLFSFYTSISLVVYTWKPNNTLPNNNLEQKV